MKTPIPRLQVITDEVLQSRYTHVELAQLCVDAGADGIQYREKRSKPHNELVQTATSMREICDVGRAQLVVNDFVDVAIEANAPAIHLGRTDESIPSARAMLTKGTIVGGTANSLDESLQVAQLDVDYLGVGPVFGTSSKVSPAPPLGIATLREICERIEKPVVAIGNIQLANVASVIEAGAYGVAVLSAVCCAEDVAAMTKSFRAVLSL